MEDAFLEVLRKTGPERVELIGAQVTLGRASENTVIFADDDAVSRRHAVLIRGSDAWTLRDTGSANGTYVNGERLRVDRVLRPGDEVTLGNTRFVFRTKTPTAAPVREQAPRLRPREPAREQAAGEVTGIVRGVQRRPVSDNHDELIFQLERYDGAGNPLPPVSVQLPRSRGGVIGEGDEVEVAGTWAGGTLRAKTVFNLSTGAELTAGPRWEYVVLIGLGALFLILLIVVLGMTVGF